MEIFSKSKITDEIMKSFVFGMWAVEYIADNEPRMYGDATMYRLMKIDEEVTPEQVYKIWRAGIVPASIKDIDNALDVMRKGENCVTDYKWTDSCGKQYYIRFMGTRNDDYGEYIRIEGCFRDISEQIEILEKSNKQEMALHLVKEMEITYTGIARALCRAYESVYYINILSGHYKEYSSNGNGQNLQFNKEGDDFYNDLFTNIDNMVYSDDIPHVMKFFADGKRIIEELNDKPSLTLSCRLLINGKPVHYSLRVVPLSQDDVVHCIIAIRNIEADIQRNHKYESRLREANKLATCDALTGAINRLGYEQDENEINRMIAEGTIKEFAVLVFDVNNLKLTNDTKGHDIGDRLIIKTSQMIGGIFENQNVYRIGGDEFVVLLRGEKYRYRSTKLAEFFESSRANIGTDSPVVAVGMSVYDPNRDKTVSDVFVRADREMYQNKSVLKSMKSPKSI